MFGKYIYTHLFDQNFAFCNGPLSQHLLDRQAPTFCFYDHFRLASGVLIG